MTPTTSSKDETFQRTSMRSGQFKPPLKRTSDTEIEVIKVVYPHRLYTLLYIYCSVDFSFDKILVWLQEVPAEPVQPTKRQTFRPSDFFKNMLQQKEAEKEKKEAKAVQRPSVKVAAEIHP